MITIDVFMVGNIEELNGGAFIALHCALGGDFGQMRRRHWEGGSVSPLKASLKYISEVSRPIFMLDNDIPQNKLASPRKQ